jgi:hypothetical protein
VLKSEGSARRCGHCAIPRHYLYSVSGIGSPGWLVCVKPLYSCSTSIHQSFSIKALRIYFASWHLPVLIPLQVNCNITYSMSSPRKSVLITGCSGGGIGAALADVFHGKGYHVFATARNPAKISECLSSAADVTVLTLDVLSSESIAASVESVNKQTGGSLDVLVDNSGGGSYVLALDCSIEKGKKLFDLNFWAPLVCPRPSMTFMGPTYPRLRIIIKSGTSYILLLSARDNMQPK